MAYKGGKVQKVMVQPINLIFRYLQNRSRVSVWLFENVNTRIEGHIIGFDEYMNLVMDNAEEIHMKKGTRKPVGRVMLKGDNITLLQQIDGGSEGGAASWEIIIRWWHLRRAALSAPFRSISISSNRFHVFYSYFFLPPLELVCSIDLISFRKSVPFHTRLRLWDQIIFRNSTR